MALILSHPAPAINNKHTMDMKSYNNSKYILHLVSGAISQSSIASIVFSIV